MPKRASAKKIIVMETNEPIIDQYKKLEAECDVVIEKITKRKARKSKKAAA